MTLPATAKEPDSSLLERGKQLLHWGIGIYTFIAVIPLFGIAIKGLASVEYGWLAVLVNFLLHPWLALFLVFFLLSPWLTLRGSNQARTLAGIVALFGALAAFVTSLGLLIPEMRINGMIAAVLFPLLCFLTNVFLINQNVQAYVTFIRVKRGLSADHWRYDENRFD